MADPFSSAADALDLFGGAAGAFISAGGYDKQAAAYGTAAAISASNAELVGKNIDLAKESTALQDKALRVQAVQNKINQAQTARQMYQVQGSARADVGAAGLTESGSALDVIRSNAQQAELQKAIVGTQGAAIETERERVAKQGEIDITNVQLQQQSYLQQSAAYLGEQGAAEGAASASRASGAGKTAGGIIKTIGTIATIAAMFAL